MQYISEGLAGLRGQSAILLEGVCRLGRSWEDIKCNTSRRDWQALEVKPTMFFEGIGRPGRSKCNTPGRD